MDPILSRYYMQLGLRPDGTSLYSPATNGSAANSINSLPTSPINLPGVHETQLFQEYIQTNAGKEMLAGLNSGFNQFISDKQNPAAKKSLEKTEALEKKMDELSGTVNALSQSIFKIVEAISPKSSEKKEVIDVVPAKEANKEK